MGHFCYEGNNVCAPQTLAFSFSRAICFDLAQQGGGRKDVSIGAAQLCRSSLSIENDDLVLNGPENVQHVG